MPKLQEILVIAGIALVVLFLVNRVPMLRDFFSPSTTA